MKLANGAQALVFTLALIACASSSACSLESAGLGDPDTSGTGGGSSTGEPTGAGGATAGAGGGGSASSSSQAASSSSAASSGSSGSSSSGGGPCGPGSTIEFQDNFDDDKINDALWTAYSDPKSIAVLETNKQVTVQPDKAGSSGGYVSNSPRSLINCSLHLEVAQVVNSDDGAEAAVYFLLNVGQANRIEFKQTGSTLEFISVVDNSVQTESMHYDTSDQRWWRFRESNGTVYWETSTNGQDWQPRRTMDTSALGFVSAAKLDFGAQGNNPNSGVAHFDNLNIPPP